jgi:N-methylhydantoinase A
MLESDIRLDNVKTYNAFIPGVDVSDFNKVIKEVEAKALEELLQEGVEKERATLLRFLDVRYVGQHHEVTVEIPNNCSIEEKHLEEIAKRFHAAHEKLYTYSTPETPIEIMNLRITAVGAVAKTGLGQADDTRGKNNLADAQKGTRKAYFKSIDGKTGFVETPVYDRNKLFRGDTLTGPAIIEERITTVIVHPGWSMHIDKYDNIIMEAAQ